MPPKSLQAFWSPISASWWSKGSTPKLERRCRAFGELRTCRCSRRHQNQGSCLNPPRPAFGFDHSFEAAQIAVGRKVSRRLAGLNADHGRQGAHLFATVGNQDRIGTFVRVVDRKRRRAADVGDPKVSGRQPSDGAIVACCS